jgi:hypothetical protein
MHLFLNIDSMAGKDFEAGLANLKIIAEKETQTAGLGGLKSQARAASVVRLSNRIAGRLFGATRKSLLLRYQH